MAALPDINVRVLVLELLISSVISKAIGVIDSEMSSKANPPKTPVIEEAEANMLESEHSVTVVVEGASGIEILNKDGIKIVEIGEGLYAANSSGGTDYIGTVWMINHETNRKQYIFNSNDGYSISLSGFMPEAARKEVLVIYKDHGKYKSVESYRDFSDVHEVKIEIHPNKAHLFVDPSEAKQNVLASPTDIWSQEAIDIFNEDM